LRLTQNGKPTAFQVANIAWKDDHVVAFGESFKKPETVASKEPNIHMNAAISIAEQHAGGTHNGHPPKLEYLMQPDDHLALVHVIQIRNDEAGTWYETYIDAHSGQPLFLNDFASHSTAGNFSGMYTVLPIPGDAMPPNGFKKITDPGDDTASPSIIAYPCWHSVSTVTTAGNNVIIYKNNDETSMTTQSSATLNFNYAFDASKGPSADTNLNAARVNAFYEYLPLFQQTIRIY
ncbi:hypothetical protein DFH07DRAFT_746553, partial [Mycena maculata]